MKAPPFEKIKCLLTANYLPSPFGEGRLEFAI
jgi:hypothetical protein